MATTSLGYRINKHPIAQSFFVDATSGIYVTKIDLFFAAKDNSFPVSLQLRPMVNGFPSPTEIIPGTQVVVPGNSVNVSTDATSATTFTFTEPVYLRGLKDYAIVLTADSKEYKTYIAQINEFLVGSTEKRVDRQPTLGSLFYSQNGNTWTASQNQDLTFKLYKANFTSTEGTVMLKNASLPKKLLNANPITTTSGSTTITVAHPYHGLEVGEDIALTGVSGTIGGVQASSINGTRTVTKVDWTGFQFVGDSSADSSVTGGGDAVLSSKNIQFSQLYPHIQPLIPINTGMTAQFRGTLSKSFAGGETAFSKETDFATVAINRTSGGKVPYMAVSDSSQTNEMSGNNSIDFKIVMGTGDSNVAPMIDLQRASLSLINYTIDKQSDSATSGYNVPIDYIAETEPTGGSSAAKHIMSPVTLDQDAVGLKILLAANRPDGADFDMYYRVAAGDTILADQDYTLVSKETNHPTDDNETVFRDYRYLVGGQGGNLDAFTKFQIKIVMTSTNAAKVPVIKDLRAIALSV